MTIYSKSLQLICTYKMLCITLLFVYAQDKNHLKKSYFFHNVSFTLDFQSMIFIHVYKSISSWKNIFISFHPNKRKNKIKTSKFVRNIRSAYQLTHQYTIQHLHFLIHFYFNTNLLIHFPFSFANVKILRAKWTKIKKQSGEPNGKNI